MLPACMWGNVIELSNDCPCTLLLLNPRGKFLAGESITPPRSERVCFFEISEVMLMLLKMSCAAIGNLEAWGTLFSLLMGKNF